MQYYSLNGHSEKVDFKNAVLKSIAPDKGLYFPTEIPKLSENITTNFHTMPWHDLAFETIKQFVGDSIPSQDLQTIIKDTLSFDTPLVEVEKGITTLELFHGPTLAFKDVGARFMARCIAYFQKEQPRKLTVLVATSGDTGGAVADGFYDVEGIEVIILYPSGKVSPLQEKQLTALGKNIRAIEVNGTFDDCQEMVKTAFLDNELNQKLGLTSANSINVARWLPQMFYYLRALQQVEKDKKTIFSVPSGNFGNICAGMMVQNLGFPIHHFIAATNQNDVVPRYLKTESYTPKKTFATISNAMDVSAPSNFIRIQRIYETFNNLKNHVTSYAFDDESTKACMQKCLSENKYLLDPHGAIGLLGLKKYLTENPTNNVKGIFLETAHPIKFAEVIEATLGFSPEIPENLQSLMTKPKKSTLCEPNYESFKAILIY